MHNYNKTAYKLFNTAYWVDKTRTCVCRKLRFQGSKLRTQHVIDAGTVNMICLTCQFMKQLKKICSAMPLINFTNTQNFHKI